MKEQAVEATIAGVANKVTYGGGGFALVMGLNASEIAAFVGALVAILGLVVQIYYKRKADKRAEELHKLRLEEIEE
jgi:hypothetical protein